MKYRIFLAFAALVALTACNKTDDNYVKNSQTPAKTWLTCTMVIAPEALNSFDFFAKYYDADGQVQSEQVTDWKDSQEQLSIYNTTPVKVWTKTVTVTKFPATLGLLFEAKPKEGIDTNAAYTWAWAYKRDFKVVNASNGVLYTDPQIGEGRTFNASEGRLEEYLNNGMGKLFNCIYTIQSNGTFTTSQWQ